MDYTLLPKQRSSARRQASSDEMAEILRAWDDEDDEMVEFIQSSKVTENSGGFDEVDMNSGQFGEDTNSLQRSRAGHPQIWSAGLVRNCKTAFLFASFFGLVRIICSFAASAEKNNIFKCHHLRTLADFLCIYFLNEKTPHSCEIYRY